MTIAIYPHLLQIKPEGFLCFVVLTGESRVKLLEGIIHPLPKYFGFGPSIRRAQKRTESSQDRIEARPRFRIQEHPGIEFDQMLDRLLLPPLRRQ